LAGDSFEIATDRCADDAVARGVEHWQGGTEYKGSFEIFRSRIRVIDVGAAERNTGGLVAAAVISERGITAGLNCRQEMVPFGTHAKAQMNRQSPSSGVCSIFETPIWR
jgi:repressor of nif and glnA expression